MTSTAAQVASIIRKTLKANNIKASVRSSVFSQGTSVDIDVEDLSPPEIKEIRSYAVQFQYGHFDGMQDLYAFSNVQKEVPQVRFVHVNVRYSDAFLQLAWDYLRSCELFADLPGAYHEARYRYDANGELIADHVRATLEGSNTHTREFWEKRLPTLAA